MVIWLIRKAQNTVKIGLLGATSKKSKNRIRTTYDYEQNKLLLELKLTYLTHNSASTAEVSKKQIRLRSMLFCTRVQNCAGYLRFLHHQLNDLLLG